MATDAERSPVACTLSGAELAERVQTLRRDLWPRVRAVGEAEGRLLLRFPREPGMIERLGEFVAFESRCCAFLGYRVGVEAGSDEVTLEIEGPPEARETLRALREDVRGGGTSEACC
jgi:hypothetical protein